MAKVHKLTRTVDMPSLQTYRIKQLMLYREIIAVRSEIHTKHINTLCGAERRTVECYTGGIYSYSDHWAAKGVEIHPDMLRVVKARGVSRPHLRWGTHL
jgi:hypothetical protein